jgi:crossover junction endodeoxyribonuclease RuvC
MQQQVYHSRDLQAWEQRWFQQQNSSYGLMQQVAWGISQRLITLFSQQKIKKIAVCCGQGNNAGDGYLVAKYLKLTFVDAGTIRTETTEMPERLKRIFAGVERIVKFYGPTEAAVEQVFMAQNPDSALKLGQARGAAVAALVNLDLKVAEYTARQIKQSVVGYGAADKEQVQMMVMNILKLSIKPQQDAADALAAAICHAHASGSMSKMAVLNALGGMARGRSRVSSRRR